MLAVEAAALGLGAATHTLLWLAATCHIKAQPWDQQQQQGLQQWQRFVAVLLQWRTGVFGAAFGMAAVVSSVCMWQGGVWGLAVVDAVLTYQSAPLCMACFHTLLQLLLSRGRPQVVLVHSALMVYLAGLVANCNRNSEPGLWLWGPHGTDGTLLGVVAVWFACVLESRLQRRFAQAPGMWGD